MAVIGINCLCSDCIMTVAQWMETVLVLFSVVCPSLKVIKLLVKKNGHY